MLQNAVRLVMAILTVVAGLVVPAAGHHAAVAYEPVKKIEFRGVIADVHWANPHIWIVVDVTDATAGEVRRWTLEGNGIGQSRVSGLTQEILKVGTRVTVVGHPARDASKHDLLFITIEIDGKVYTRRPGFEVE
jgi:hypothetical protein